MSRPCRQRLLLGSASPRRADLVQALGVPFDVIAPGIAEPAHATVEELAVAKFNHLVAQHVDRTILTADTLVILGSVQLGKPTDRDHARRMLAACSGEEITVASAVCVGNGDTMAVRGVASSVRMRELGDDEIDGYLATGAADDKAGALALQAQAAHFVDDTAPSFTADCEHGGCFSNVMGLPMCAVAELLNVAANPSLCAWPGQ